MISGEIFRRLEPISKTDRLLPVGGGDEFKAPLLKDWPNHPGLSIEQLKSWRGLRSVGIAMDDLACADVDGITAIGQSFPGFTGLRTSLICLFSGFLARLFVRNGDQAC